MAERQGLPVVQTVALVSVVAGAIAVGFALGMAWPRRVLVAPAPSPGASDDRPADRHLP